MIRMYLYFHVFPYSISNRSSVSVLEVYAEVLHMSMMTKTYFQMCLAELPDTEEDLNRFFFRQAYQGVQVKCTF